MSNIMSMIASIKEIEADIEANREQAETRISDAEKLQRLHDLLDEAQRYFDEHDLATIIRRTREPMQEGPYATKHKGKPNVQVLEEILKLHGKPMYITDLLHWAQVQGVRFKGDSDPKSQIRNSLNGAKARFVNLGNNTWWLADRPVPDAEEEKGIEAVVFDQ